MANKLSDIQAQITALQAQAAEMIAKEKADVIAEMKKDIQNYGITAKDLGFGKGSEEVSTSTRAPRGSKPVKVFKYVKSETEKWSGSTRGIKPKWVDEAIASGEDLSKYLNPDWKED
jgi:DNA-binding protein H-NS